MPSAIASFFRNLGLALGLVAWVEAASLSPIVLETGADGTSVAVCRVERGLGAELRSVLEAGTELRIVYRSSLYAGQGLRYDDVTVQSLRYRGLTRDYLFSAPSGQASFARLEEGAEALFSWRRPLPSPEARLLVLSARLEIPELEDPALVTSLWGGAEPRASLDLGALR